ncbi:MAG: hypothetical protein O3A46_08865 [Candidatus Poribacteria bacterium]|nr:hypothetical protein [Candidatus Poribacteria bacterium]
MNDGIAILGFEYMMTIRRHLIVGEGRSATSYPDPRTDHRVFEGDEIERLMAIFNSHEPTDAIKRAITEAIQRRESHTEGETDDEPKA